MLKRLALLFSISMCGCVDAGYGGYWGEPVSYTYFESVQVVDCEPAPVYVPPPPAYGHQHRDWRYDRPAYDYRNHNNAWQNRERDRWADARRDDWRSRDQDARRDNNHGNDRPRSGSAARNSPSDKPQTPAKQDPPKNNPPAQASNQPPAKSDPPKKPAAGNDDKKKDEKEEWRPRILPPASAVHPPVGTPVKKK